MKKIIVFWFVFVTCIVIGVKDINGQVEKDIYDEDIMKEIDYTEIQHILIHHHFGVLLQR